MTEPLISIERAKEEIRNHPIRTITALLALLATITFGIYQIVKSTSPPGSTGGSVLVEDSTDNDSPDKDFPDNEALQPKYNEQEMADLLNKIVEGKRIDLYLTNLNQCFEKGALTPIRKIIGVDREDNSFGQIRSTLLYPGFDAYRIDKKTFTDENINKEGKYKVLYITTK